MLQMIFAPVNRIKGVASQCATSCGAVICNIQTKHLQYLKSTIRATMKNMRKNQLGVVCRRDRKFPHQHEHYVSCNSQRQEAKSRDATLFWLGQVKISIFDHGNLSFTMGNSCFTEYPIHSGKNGLLSAKSLPRVALCRDSLGKWGVCREPPLTLGKCVP